MRSKRTVFIGVIVISFCFLQTPANAGGTPHLAGPALDYTLMGFKEQGVWYFLCCAPTYGCRIPPHYLTIGPPPPPYCPPPCVPVSPHALKAVQCLGGVVAPDRYWGNNVGNRRPGGNAGSRAESRLSRAPISPISTEEPSGTASVKSEPAKPTVRTTTKAGNALRWGAPDK